MKPAAHRSQATLDLDLNSRENGTGNPEPEKCARQDAKEEADINWLLRRHGVQGLFSGQASAGYGEQDFDLLGDRTLALRQRSDLERTYTPPKGMEREFPTLSAFLDGLQDGRITLVPADSVPEVPSGTKSAAASESAPGGA